MALFVQRTDPVRLLKRRLVLAGLLLLVALGIRGIWGVYQKLEESRALRHESEVQLQGLKEREAALRGDIAKLKSDRGVEEVLRGEYELAREGEGVIVIVEPQQEAPEPESSSFQPLKKLFQWW
jgi:cell division protein FtsB